MGFTGRLGTGNSRLGNILLGVVDTLGDGTFDYKVHQVESNKIRVKFDTRVNLVSATQVPRYSLSIVSAPGSFVVPGIVSVRKYDSTETSVVLFLDKNLTTGATYSLAVGEIFDVFGDSASFVAKSFIANVTIPPLARGAYLSKRATVDVLFDKNVGLTSAAATMTIQSSLGGPAVAMTQLPWGPEGLPSTTLRFSLPAGMPSANDYVINYAGVTDESQNVGSGTIPLTLRLRTAVPHTFATVSQLQITDAFVADVSNDLIDTATVRVYFNGPVLDGDITANWSVAVEAPHKYTDTVNTITAPNAADLATLMTLLNDVKVTFNAHIVEEQVHFQNDTRSQITAPNATDLPTSVALAAQIHTMYLAHLGRILIHSHPDTENDFVPATVNDLSTSIVLANLVKTSFNRHVLASYPIPFSVAYPTPINSITSRARYSTQEVYATVGPYTSFVDLHVVTTSAKNRLLLTATVTSEDGASVTNPADDTGSITARSLDDPSEVLSTLVRTNSGVDIYFDKETLFQRSTDIEVMNGDDVILPVGIVASSDEKTLAWALNNLIFAYSLHIASSNGANHLVNDTSNTVSTFDYVTNSLLSELIVKANSFKEKLNLHISATSFHFNQDADIVRSQSASDVSTLLVLIRDIRDTYLRHNMRNGIHDGIGARVVSAKLYDVLRLNTDLLQHDETHIVEGFVRGYYFDNEQAEARYTNLQISEMFVGSADRPSLASAVPKLGLVKLEEGMSFESDTVELYFSKKMKEVTLDSSNVSLTGGSIQQKVSLWLSPQIASIEVMRMESISYSATVTGLLDVAGNQIF